MGITGDQQLVKKINKSLVLDLIRSASPISRADISARTGLNKGTVSSLVQELLDSRLVRELGPGASSGGRKPVMLAFDPDAGAAVGVDLGVNYVLAVLTDLSGRVKTERRLPLADRSYERVFALLASVVRELADTAANLPYGTVGIGVGVPGMVNECGTVLFAPNLNWRRAELQADLADALGLPVTIDNEANFGAVGERQFGAGLASGELIYVSAGIGIGAGLIVGGSLYKGVGGLSGEVGHMTLEMEGLPCTCGSRGCWEQYASERALVRQAGESPALRTALAERPGEEFEALLDLARGGHPEALALFRWIGAYLGVGIANLIHAFNPQRIVIGNRLTQAAEWIADPMREEIRRRTFEFHRSRAEIEFSRLGIRSTALGAAYSAIERFFAETKVTVG